MAKKKPMFKVTENEKPCINVSFGNNGEMVCPHCKKKVTIDIKIDLK